MVCRVALKITDKNTGDNKVEFVDSADEVTNAKDGEYKIHLTAVPADDTEVKVGTTPASADKDTAAASLDDVTMTKVNSYEDYIRIKNKMLECKTCMDCKKYAIAYRILNCNNPITNRKKSESTVLDESTY